MRTTHTVATLAVSSAAYAEIRQRLEEVDYHHVFLDDGTIDMTGIGLVTEEEPTDTALPVLLEPALLAAMTAVDETLG